MFWIDVYAPDGTRRGSGPLTTATRWEQTRRLSRAGSIRTRLPASDARAGAVQQQDELRCFARRGGAVVVIGAGIAEDVTLDATGEWLAVAGDDLLRELAWRTVGELELKQIGNVSPDDVAVVDPGGGTSTSHPNACDGNPATSASIQIISGDYLYVRYSTIFDRISFNLDTFNTGGETLSAVQYFSVDFDGSGTAGWKTVSGLVDGTLNAGSSLGKDGTVSFTRPNDWVPVNHDGASGYIVRLAWSGTTDTVQVAEVLVRGFLPDVDDVETVMALAPAGWLDNGVNTADGTLHRFEYESVLEALVLLAERSGEHFRLSTFTSEYGAMPRQLEWLQTAGTTVTARLMQAPPDTTGMPPTHGVITRLVKRISSYEKVTRLYAFGGGNGAGRLTLAGVTDTSALPAGWTLSTNESYIDTGGTPRVDAYRQFSEVKAIKDGLDETASGELFRAALAWLQNHSQDATHYEVEVAGLETEVEPGDAVTLAYRGSIEDENGRRLWVDIDGEFLVLEVTTVIDETGLRTERLLLSGDRRYPETDEQAIARALRQERASRAYAQQMETETLRRKLVQLGVINAV